MSGSGGFDNVSGVTSGESDEPSVKKVLQALDLGSSVAEHDELLQQHFVETSTFRQVLQGKVDIVAGDKGTGKTAIFRILKERYTSYSELNSVEVIPAFNPAGSPIFQRLLETETLDESQYISVWKTYFLSLAGNWVLNFFAEDGLTDDMKILDRLLKDADLRSSDDEAETIWGKLINRLKRLMPSVRALEGKATSSSEGMPILTGRLEFGAPENEPDPSTVRPDDALRLLQNILANEGFTFWLVVDRLDEAFQGQPAVERPALRALFRTYLDMLDFENVRPKLFVRRDLFDRIAAGGFVNLTHINARRVDITWDDEDLWDLLNRRLRGSDQFMELLGAAQLSDVQLFNAVFPDKVDYGSKKPETWPWILTRIRDANDVKPPRNLIDLVLRAQSQQLKKEERDPRLYRKSEERLLSGDALKRGLQALSEARVQDTLLAEAGDNAQLIEMFRNGKAEHNTETLAALLGQDATAKILLLKSIGFLEPVGKNYKIPMLYRGGLGITQGKAFSAEVGSDVEETDDDE